MKERHPFFKPSALWSISLFSVAVFVPLVLAKSLLPRSEESVKSSLETAPEQLQEQILNQQEWRHRIISQSLSLDLNSATSKGKSTSLIAVANSQKSLSPQHSSKSQPSANNQTPIPDLSQQPPLVEMRVVIAKGVNSLVVASSTPAELLDGNGKVIGKLTANQGKNVLPNGPNIRIGNLQTAKGVWVTPTKEGLVFVGESWYRGDLLLISQGDSLLAVNYVDLESYLKSVVGAEMNPGWPMAALKAQAVAARSYALVHSLRPADALYDLGSTQRWQVYKGMKSEWNTTNIAVQETTGLFLSYKGGVVESMYAASDSIVTNVFGGMGMSQNGAKDLAVKGYNYQEILANYYQGASLSWIESGKASDPKK
ncbi:MAG: SpoIID/LytB domain-containing protein [Symploca sp. SIO1C4]|uniref:SpoIID/LytB domain-containing protein n=1 Tax=Symploca sp. SIO1C4 TaxID=2607765 RepID=A0A6B3N8R8_9CYAN|nr:SpoIID/LytB domain-containing protein [Symploca sp. SIO1C4]NET04909.1 SpoIID/LytB domain-containing protein [Symploca sp. SIO2B6]